jgi:hypothetical protein
MIFLNLYISSWETHTGQGSHWPPPIKKARVADLQAKLAPLLKRAIFLFFVAFGILANTPLESVTSELQLQSGQHLYETRISSFDILY